jgi:superfamily II DNA or RNA helicase
MNALAAFRATVKDSEGEPYDIDFYNFNTQTNCYEFSRGNLELIRAYFGHTGIEDRRVSVPMQCASVSTTLGYGIQFNGQLKPSQQKVVDKYLTYDGYGQIKAPPRFGKTVVMTYLTCRLGMKTLFLSHQVDLSKQALQTFYKFTNTIDIEYALNRQVIGLVEDWDDLDKFDVAFMPYQKFIDGESTDPTKIKIAKKVDPIEMLEQYKNRFGVVWVDESHKSSAKWYSRISGAFNSRWRGGVSGTTERKDGMHVIGSYVLGPVVAEGEVEQIPCKVSIIHTGVRVPYQIKNPKIFRNCMLNFLSKHPERNELVYQTLLGWAKAGHSIIAVGDRVDQIDMLVRRLRAAGLTAEPFHAKAFGSGKERQQKNREAVLQRCRSGETQVCIAYRTMVLGIDVPRWNAFFNLSPSANGFNYYQEFSRVRTPFGGKVLGYVVDFADEHHLVEAYLGARKKVYREQGFEVEEIQTQLVQTPGFHSDTFSGVRT